MWFAFIFLFHFSLSRCFWFQCASHSFCSFGIFLLLVVSADSVSVFTTFRKLFYYLTRMRVQFVIQHHSHHSHCLNKNNNGLSSQITLSKRFSFFYCFFRSHALIFIYLMLSLNLSHHKSCLSNYHSNPFSVSCYVNCNRFCASDQIELQSHWKLTHTFTHILYFGLYIFLYIWIYVSDCMSEIERSTIYVIFSIKYACIQ